MFLRKVTVIVVPLLMLAVVCLTAPLFGMLDGFTANVLRGALMGVCLALLLPLSGAVRRREPFAGLLWVPAVLTLLVIGYQMLALRGVSWPVLHLLATTDGCVVLMESCFGAYMLTTCIRTQL